MRVYVKKDIAVQMLNLSLGPTMLEDLPSSIDAYESIQRSEMPIQVFSDLGFNAPRGIALAQDGSIFIADTGNSRIVQVNTDGKVINTFGKRTPEGQLPPAPGTFIEPWGIAVDEQGNVYVADTWNHRIQKFDPSGNFLLDWGNAGQPGNGTNGFWGPRGIAVGTNGRVYVTDTGNKRVLVFDTNGKFLLEFDKSGSGSLDEPVGIALGQDGQIYVADTWNQRVAVFSADGQFQTSWRVQGWNSFSLDNKPLLATGTQGQVYVTDPEGYRVIIFSAGGQPQAVFGQAGLEADAFGMPSGIVSTKNGILWVVDAGNNRLEKFAPIK
jgi:DNA-binding beta-propeller fold protein YncE